MDTKNLFIAAATEQFAERGFYGVSIAQVAEQVGLSKQALLHHFKSKEGLYGEVLERIAAELRHALSEALEAKHDETSRAVRTLMTLYHFSHEHRNSTRILVRELLDNPARAHRIEHWVLKPLLLKLSEIIQLEYGARQTASRQTASRQTASRQTASRQTASRQTASRQTASRKTTPNLTAAQAFNRLYQAISVIHYYVISEPTLKPMLGESEFEEMHTEFEKALEQRFEVIIFE